MSNPRTSALVSGSASLAVSSPVAVENDSSCSFHVVWSGTDAPATFQLLGSNFDDASNGKALMTSAVKMAAGSGGELFVVTKCRYRYIVPVWSPGTISTGTVRVYTSRE